MSTFGMLPSKSIKDLAQSYNSLEIVLATKVQRLLPFLLNQFDDEI